MVDRRAACIGVGRCQRGRVCSVLPQAAIAADHLTQSHRITAVDGQHSALANIDGATTQAACGAAIAQLQRAGTDRGGAVVAIVGRERGGARAGLFELAAAADYLAQRQCIAAIDGQRAIVGDGSRDRASGAAITQLQRAGTDCGAAAVAVVSRERGGARAGLFELAAAADYLAQRQCIAAVDGQRAIVGDGSRD